LSNPVASLSSEVLIVVVQEFWFKLHVVSCVYFFKPVNLIHLPL